jgi:two-component system, OmpR family, alkaline phosphatase synthesis response regulator PhoP
MNRPSVLLVEDEPSIARGLIFNLEEEGFRVVHVSTGEEAIDTLAQEDFALVVLDLMLPGIDGIQVCRRLRRLDPRLPVLMLTARGEEKDRVAGLSAGADDYLTKPFSLDEFLLRVKGMLRRSAWYHRTDHAATFTFDGNRVDLENATAHTSRGEQNLTELEVRMLRLFFRREGETLSRAELLEGVWGMAPDAETRTLDNFIVRLRRYFEDDPAVPRHFLTVRGRGYRFVRNPDIESS